MPWTVEDRRDGRLGQAARRALGAPDVVARKGTGAPLVMVTAYDAPSARAVDAAGVDMILVGDSVAMVVLGYDDTLHVTDRRHGAPHRCGRAHQAARARRRRPAVDELPPLARRHRRQRRAARARRSDGGEARGWPQARRRDQRDPRRRDPGDGPSRPHAAVGAHASVASACRARRSTRRGRSSTTRSRWRRPACFAIVLECVPDAVARMVTDSVPVPTIGIGAGRHCDGQVLVYHDILGFEDRVRPKFVRRYADLGGDATRAIERFADDVRAGRFPASGETYHAADTSARRSVSTAPSSTRPPDPRGRLVTSTPDARTPARTRVHAARRRDGCGRGARGRRSSTPATTHAPTRCRRRCRPASPVRCRASAPFEGSAS